MLQIFDGSDANAVWLKAVKSVLAEPASIQNTRLGESKELLHSSFHVANPRQRWISARTPCISPAFAIAEVFWILNGSNQASFINYWNPSLPKFAGDGYTYHGAYGYRIKNQFGFNQLERAFDTLKNNPDSRQVVIQIWDPKSDLPHSDGTPVSKDIPCNICSILKIRNNRLEWLQIMRSNDIFLGMPYNIIQFTTIQEVLSGWLGIEPGGYFQVSDSLHAYMHDIENFNYDENELLPNNSDQLNIEKDLSQTLISTIYEQLCRLTQPQLSRSEFSTISNSFSENIPTGYRNLFLVTCAYAARKRNWNNEEENSINRCSNRALQHIWQLWSNKNKG